MTYIGSWKIDDLLTFYCNTQVFATGVATDADSVPTYRVYEDETGTPLLTGSMALIDSANTAGFYSEQITLSAANGFERGKCYSIYIAATVSSVAGATHRTFQLAAAVDIDTIKTNPVVNGGTITFPTNATLASTTNITAGTIAVVTTVTNQLTAAAIATGVWTDTTAGDFTVALSVGKSLMNGVALGTGLTVNDITTKTGRSLAASGLDSVVVSDLGAVPSTTAKIVDAIAFLFMSLRNLRTTTSTQDKVSNDAGAAIGTSTVSDDGVTFSKGKYS